MATILLVDDEEPLRALLAELLTQDGHAVLEAWNGRDALQQLGRELPQLVVSDVMMPVMDGRALCRALKARPETATVPIILMSAVAFDDAARGCADALLMKPFSLDDLETLVERMLPASG